jgi:hypothetical protein
VRYSCGRPVPGYRSWGSGFDSWRYQIFWEVVDLVRGPLSLVSTTDELLGRKSSDFGLERREYGSGEPSCWQRDTLYPQKLILTSPTSGGHPVDIVRSRTKATKLFVFGWYTCGLDVSKIVRYSHFQYSRRRCNVQQLYAQNSYFSISWTVFLLKMATNDDRETALGRSTYRLNE